MTPEESDGIARALADIARQQREQFAAEVVKLREEFADTLARALVPVRELIDRTAETMQALSSDLATLHGQSISRTDVETLVSGRVEVIDQRLGLLHNAIDEQIGRLSESIESTAAGQVAGITCQGYTLTVQRSGMTPITVPLPEPLDLPVWQPGEVYRSGSVVQCYMGRTYECVHDTYQEPGDSEHWRRRGTSGLRLIGPEREKLEPGDVFAREGAQFIADGVSVRLLSAKPVTENTLDREYRKLHKLIADRAPVEQVEQIARTLADMQGTVLQRLDELDAAQRSNGDAVTHAAQWIANRSPLIDRMLESEATR